MHIEFDHVSFSYDDKQENMALKDVSFELPDGKALGIAGPTGSGKSTLIRHLNGLLHPTQGHVRIDGTDLSDAHAQRMARNHVGMVFQYPEQQLFAATVYDDIAFGPRNFGLDEESVKERVHQALLDVRLTFDDIAERNPFKLSGGQQRRVALAGVLACQPDLLVLDEPTAGLDPASRKDFLELMVDLHIKGRSMIIVSHTIEDFVHLVDNVCILSNGSVDAFGQTDEVLSDINFLARRGLSAPQAHVIACHLRSCGFRLARRLYDEETLVDDLVRILQ